MLPSGLTAAQSGALRAVVPPRQLPDAVSTEVARQSVVEVGGPPLGGVLFGFGRALPFLFDAVSYACSTLSLLAMRTPFQEKREPDRSAIRSQIAEGFRFLWAHPFLRTCALLFGLANFIFPGVLIVIVVAVCDRFAALVATSLMVPRPHYCPVFVSASRC